jgi:hypothetical protein
MKIMRTSPHPFALSLSKGRPYFWPRKKKGQGFDKLSLNG